MLPSLKGSFGPLPVVWTSAVNCVASGNDLTKNAGGTDWNAGAVSVAALTGNGYVEFKAGDLLDRFMCGLSVGNAGQGFEDIDYALFLSASPSYALQIYEGGAERSTDVGTSADDDTYRVQRIGTEITYWQKLSGGSWTLLYTSLVASTGDLLVDCSIYIEGDAIADAVTRRL